MSSDHLLIDSTTEQLAINNDLLIVQAALINQIVQVTRGTLVLDEVLHSIALQMCHVLQVSGCLIVQAEESQQMVASSVSVVTAQQESVTSVCKNFYEYFHPLLAQGKPLIMPGGEQRLPRELQDSAKKCGLCSLLIAPLLHRQSSIGGMTLYQCEHEREWSPQEIAFVQAIADQCAIALTLVALETRCQTEQKKRSCAESAFIQSQRRLRAICNQTSQFIGLLTPDGTVIEVNQAALDFAGLKVQDILARPFWEVQWWPASLETHKQLQEAIATAAAGEFIRYEVDVLAKSDRVATIDFSLKPHRDETGQVVLLIFEGRDITNYNRTQSALESSVARNRALLEAIPDLIFRVSRDGIYLDCKADKENALPVQVCKIVGRHLHECLPTEVAGLIWHHIELALETHKIQIIEYQICLNGKSRDFEARIVKSGLDEVAVIVQDITERVKARVLLQQVNNALEVRVQERTAALREANNTLRREIIERKRIEAALRESEERFRQAVVNAPFPIMIHAEDGEILQINHVWTELTGYTQNDIPTITEWTERAFGKQKEIVQASIQSLYNLDDRVDQGEFTITTQQGANRIWNFSSAPLGWLTDGRRLIISMATDITERKQVESGVELLHSITQAIFTSQDFHAALNVAIQKVCEATGWDFGEAWVPNAEGSALECSPAWFSNTERLKPFRTASEKLTFTPGRGLPGRVWLSQQPEWRRDVSAETNQVYLRAELAREVGLKAGLGIPLLTTNGVLAVLVFYMFDSQDEDQQLIELISASTELGLMIQRKQTEGEIRKALEKEKELTELKSRFISMTSHEFRTPLTTIQSSAELLEHYSHKWTEERKLTHLHRIQTSVKHMTKLLNDVLIIGKAEAGKLKLDPVPLDLEKFCTNLVEELQLNDTNHHTITFTSSQGIENFQVEERGREREGVQARGGVGEVSANLGSNISPPPPCMDEKLLRQILENLLSNAIKYSPNGSTVEFTLSRHQNQAVFQIRDQGIGIPTEDQQRLFETFHRASNVGTIAGTGLGLAIVKKCVDIHQGQIAMDSEIGVGTTFTVTLPIYNSVLP